MAVAVVAPAAAEAAAAAAVAAAAQEDGSSRCSRRRSSSSSGDGYLKVLLSDYGRRRGRVGGGTGSSGSRVFLTGILGKEVLQERDSIEASEVLLTITREVFAGGGVSSVVTSTVDQYWVGSAGHDVACYA